MRPSRELRRKFAVVDTGPGISPENVPHLFEPYWASRHAESGNGLGLFIAKGIVEAHGGDIWVETTLGQGTTFMYVIARFVPHGA